MITIGIDPHKRSHTAVAVDDEENEVARTRVIAGPNQLAELNGFAGRLDDECRWAIEAAHRGRVAAGSAVHQGWDRCR